MKKNKIIAFTSAFAMVSSIFVTSASVNANSTVTEGITFEMNSASTAETRVVDVFYVGELTSVGSISIALTADTTISNLKFASVFDTDTDDTDADGGKWSQQGKYEAIDGAYILMAGHTTGYTVKNKKMQLGTITFTVDASVEDVVLTVDTSNTYNMISDSYMSEISGDPSMWGYGYTQQASSFKVVKELSKTKKIVADKLEVANTYADEKVDAYSAAIESADADKTINWVLSNAEGKTFTKAANIGDKTAITGEATIVLGLKVFGENRTNVANVVVTVD